MIKEAIIPLAGLGTRLLPFSKIIPKELLPLGEKTILEHILDECIDAGISKIILVISKKKEIIKKYFNKDNYLSKYLINKELSLLIPPSITLPSLSDSVKVKLITFSSLSTVSGSVILPLRV